MGDASVGGTKFCHILVLCSISGVNLGEEFTAINPLHKVPVIQDGDFILKERLVYEYSIKIWKIRNGMESWNISNGVRIAARAHLLTPWAF